MSAITSCFAPWYKGIYLLLFAILTYYLHNNWRTWVKLSFIYFAFWKKFLCDTPVRANAHRNLYLLAFVGSKWPIALWDFMIQQYIQELTSYLLHFFQAQPTFLRRVFCFCLQHSRSLVIFDKFVLLNSSALHIYHKTSFWFKFAFDDTHTPEFSLDIKLTTFARRTGYRKAAISYCYLQAWFLCWYRATTCFTFNHTIISCAYEILMRIFIYHMPNDYVCTYC